MRLNMSRNVEWMSPATAPGTQHVEKRRSDSLEYQIHLRLRGLRSLPYLEARNIEKRQVDEPCHAP